MENPNQSARSGLATDAAISRALDFMWVRHRSQILERVAVLEAAASAVIARTLTKAEREAAQAAAHKLAGTLGMFNLNRGTDLARELEHAYLSESAPDVESGIRLASLTSELRVMIESRPEGIESRQAGTASPASSS
jgi:HPt (histidine-containing phosphotransfer) domain-containing protein